MVIQCNAKAKYWTMAHIPCKIMWIHVLRRLQFRYKESMIMSYLSYKHTHGTKSSFSNEKSCILK